MVRPEFLPDAERKELHVLANLRLSEARLARHAHSVVLVNDGWSCEALAEALLKDDDTVRSWHSAGFPRHPRGSASLEIGREKSFRNRLAPIRIGLPT
jgi:hypothetical protein